MTGVEGDRQMHDHDHRLRIERSVITARMLPTPLYLLSALAIGIATLAGCSASRVMPDNAPSTTATTRPARNDYGNTANWLCRPGRADACNIDLTATILPFDGAPRREGWEANLLAPVDCFYVYPTISNDPTPNSDMTPGLEEQRAVAQQLARFGSACRLYAPVYRQVTLAGLRNSMQQGAASGIDPKLAYDDVADAWHHYLQHDNKGRGVILIGHSQGARLLGELTKHEIEGKPVQQQLVAAYLIGYNIGVAKGRDTGGQFRTLPLCRAAGQTGCVVAYSTFRAGSPPPANSRFGRMTGEVVAACTNPAALAGGRGQLHAYLPVKANLLGQPVGAVAWGAASQGIDTPFVSAPALADAECIERDGASYLAVTATPTYLGRGVDVPGNLTVGGRVLDDWGLHLVDIDLALGSLVALAQKQALAYGERAE